MPTKMCNSTARMCSNVVSSENRTIKVWIFWKLDVFQQMGQHVQYLDKLQSSNQLNPLVPVEHQKSAAERYAPNRLQIWNDHIQLRTIMCATIIIVNANKKLVAYYSCPNTIPPLLLLLKFSSIFNSPKHIHSTIFSRKRKFSNTP